jgi:CubicO group peptidase (beta-lactamase class C family)
MRYLLLFILLVANVPAQPFAFNPRATVVQTELGAQMDQYLTPLSSYGFWGTVLVAKGEQVLLHKGYGLADRERGLANGTQTVYEIASIVKQFTATAILKLESEGKLKTGDPISKYLPEVPPDKRGITLHHLLTHSSGLPFDCAGAEKMSRAEFIKCMLTSKPHAEPGQQYAYSNAGYGLLAAIIEIVSGQSYESYLQEHLFKPAGMQATCFNGACGALPPDSIGHSYDEAADRGSSQSLPLTWEKRGAWGLGTTAADLYLWEQALRHNRILKTAATKKLFTAQMLTGGAGASYGYGWALTKTKQGRTIIEHDGLTFTGYNALYRRYPEENLVVIIASNRFFGSFMPFHTVAQALDAMLFQQPYVLPPAPLALSAEHLKKYAGTYQLASGAKFIARLHDNALQIGAEGQEAINLLAAVDDKSAALLASFNERTLNVLHGIRQGDYAPYQQASAEPMTAAQAREIGSAWLSRLEAKNGALKTVTSLGTMPEAGFLRSFVRLGFERGEEVRRLRWENGKLVSIYIGTPPLLVTTLQPQTTTDFTGFHLGLNRPLPIRFVSNDAGQITGLTMLAPGQKVTATKIAPAP